jgi:REP element-mobilizing transposase RayT
MPYDPEIHHRRSLRLRGYDYSQPGSYYVTLCTQGKEHLFGQIVEGEMRRNEWGDHVARCWEWLGQQYPYIDLDEWTVMPNHLHGIIVITDRRGGSRTAPTNTRLIVGRGGSRTAPTNTRLIVGRGASRSAPTKRKPLGRLVGAFKTVSTDDINQLRGTPARPLWQRDFYDHIIRNEDELNKIREYIRTNPLRWASDPDNL